jgi:signal transduction histidine kinase/DNA-binding response OmpR family regulator
MTVSNICSSLNNYAAIDSSSENIKNISFLSRGIFEISVERGFYNYSYYDASKKDRFSLEKQKTNDWFFSTHIKDTVISKNLNALQNSVLILQSKIEFGKETPKTAYIKYTQLNDVLNNLIEREIINCKSPQLTKLANNYYNYVILKEAALLKREIILQRLIDDKKNEELDNSLLKLFYEAKDFEKVVDFKLINFAFPILNKDLIQFKKSSSLSLFNTDSDLIFEKKLEISPDLWWSKSAAIISKFTALEKNNLAFILDYANKEKQAALRSIVTLFSILTLFLIGAFVLIYKLIKNLSTSLNAIAESIKKISLGEIINKPNFSGNAEFIAISHSFNELLQAISEQIDLALKISSGDFGSKIGLRSPNDLLNNSLNTMSLEINRLNQESKETSLMEKNIIEVNKSIVESKDLDDFGSNICQTLVKQTQGCQANFYISKNIKNTNQLLKIGGYADDKNTPSVIAIGEGLVGEVAKTNQQNCLNNLPYPYSRITTSLGEFAYYNILITPISYKEEVIGVVEIGSTENFNDNHKKLLIAISDSIGSTIKVFIRNEELKIFSQEINDKNNILQVQEEELRLSNEELSRQTMLLKLSEEESKHQAAELKQTNAFLEEKGQELEYKNNEVGLKNEELVTAQEELNIKAAEITQASKYKSEFLANMSHELRTPLNSILILSDLLKDNSTGNLSNAQIDNLSVINSSGKDLLNLITDILDISKIEAGKVEVYPEKSIVERVFSDMDGLFKAQMQKKNIEFTALISDDCPRDLHADIGKLEQILKNFLSNALKFTPSNGKVSLLFSSSNRKKSFTSPILSKLNSNEILTIHIEDNGIGISEENKKKLFQTFQQADSSTSRKYGGTGLGLYISKELAMLLGGEVDFQSELNKGSVFSLYIPVTYQASNCNETHNKKDYAAVEIKNGTDNYWEDNQNLNSLLEENTILKKSKEKNQPSLEKKPKPTAVTLDLTGNLNDDRSLVTIDDKTILIIEDDASFAEILLQVARDNGFKAIVTYQGETGYQYAKKHKPKAIILDMKLPGIDGWTVLKWLKEDPELQHIPVHVMSCMNREKLAKEMGAFDFLIKPITIENLKKAFESIDIQINKIFKKVLIVEDDVKLNYSIKELVHNCDRNVICIQAYTFNEAENILKNDAIDCAIIDIGLPDSKSIDTISALRKTSINSEITIIVNTGKSLTEDDELELQNSADKVVIKTNNATERLKDEITLFLDRVETSDKKNYKLNSIVLGGEVLEGKNILIVDDDIRNIYALSSALSAKGAVISTAFNGIEALEILHKNATIDIVLMDIMMPEMDGYEATRKIRENPKWKNLPIIALTAKAMNSDREEILNAGASDYQSKPINIQQLITLISIWTYQ